MIIINNVYLSLYKTYPIFLKVILYILIKKLKIYYNLNSAPFLFHFDLMLIFSLKFTNFNNNNTKNYFQDIIFTQLLIYTYLVFSNLPT